MSVPAPILNTQKRDAWTTISDRCLALSQTATFFALAVAGSLPDGISKHDVKALAQRFLDSSAEATPYRYWCGEEVSNPLIEAREVKT